jgi:hypothetical protein
MGTGVSFPGVKRQGREADHSPPNSAEVKKMWIYTSTPLYVKQNKQHHISMIPKVALRRRALDLGPSERVFLFFTVEVTSDQNWEVGITSSSPSIALRSEVVTKCSILFYYYYLP